MKQFMKRPLIRLAAHLSRWHKVIYQHSLIEMARRRLAIARGLILISFFVIAGRLVEVMIFRNEPHLEAQLSNPCQLNIPRSDIVDRRGEVLATHLITASVYANPKVILNAKEAAKKLTKVLPHIRYDFLYQRLTSQKGFVWLTRHISPKTQHDITQLGIPGIYLRKDYCRVYPYGPLVSHVLGYCGIDNNGLSGVEKFFDIRLQNDKTPLRLSIDVRLQHIVCDELQKSIAEFEAIAGNAILMDLKTGEVLAMVSLPHFNPNLPNGNKPETTFNRNTLGVYEPGSTFKILNTAIALESGSATSKSIFDATHPIKIGRFTVTDFKGKNRELTLAEAFVYSSNIAAIKIAQQFGSKIQKNYFEKFGVFKPETVQVPEIGQPLIPSAWSSATTMTASYGYGISVTPLQILTIVGGIINGYKPIPTLILENQQGGVERISAPMVSSKTSQIIRDLMRINATEGTSRKVDEGGFSVFAKTGTAYQAKNKGYGHNKSRTTSCVGGFPYNNPRYVFLVMLDDPKGSKSTYGYATAGWNAAPTAGKIISRVAPLLGVQPLPESEKEPSLSGWAAVKHNISR